MEKEIKTFYAVRDRNHRDTEWNPDAWLYRVESEERGGKHYKQLFKPICPVYSHELIRNMTIGGGYDIEEILSQANERNEFSVPSDFKIKYWRSEECQFDEAKKGLLGMGIIIISILIIFALCTFFLNYTK